MQVLLSHRGQDDSAAALLGMVLAATAHSPVCWIDCRVQSRKGCLCCCSYWEWYWQPRRTALYVGLIVGCSLAKGDFAAAPTGNGAGSQGEYRFVLIGCSSVKLDAVLQEMTLLLAVMLMVLAATV